jgi:glucose/arabinose dehydrogenase
MRILLAGCLLFGVAGIAAGPGRPPCDADNGGIKLPPGFCAQVVADNLGAARHLVVAPNGDVYVALLSGSGGLTISKAKGGVVGLRDTDGDGKFDVKEEIGDVSSTGIALRNGYLYVAMDASIIRYKMTPGQLKPSGPAEIVVTDLPAKGGHRQKGIAFDGKGSLYVNLGSLTNDCTSPDRRPGVLGQDPCPELDTQAGIWKFSENKLDQKEADGSRYATGLRQMLAITWHEGKLFAVMNNRDQLHVFFPDRFTDDDNSERPSESMYRIDKPGQNFGWPYCFYDFKDHKLVLNPEYGGDGKEIGRCKDMSPPVAAFPAHWAPVDVMFYNGQQFPKKYRGGAFIAFHGSWNRAPQVQGGYNITFQPFSGEKPSGQFEVFADGFSGTDHLINMNDAVYRPDGIAQAPDGSLYVTDSQRGRIWRIFYRGE